MAGKTSWPASAKYSASKSGVIGLTRSVAMEIPAVETPRSGSYHILGETLRGFREAFTENGMPQHCEIQILARTEEESEGWGRVIRGLLR